MTIQHRLSRTVSSLVLLALGATALTGCGLTNSDAHFADDDALIEVGSTHDLILSDVVDLSTLHVRGANDAIGFSVMTVPGFLFGERQVVRVQAMGVGTATLDLMDDETLLDSITVESATVATFDVVADRDLYGDALAGEYGVLTGQDVLLRLEAHDALDRTFDAFAPRSMGVDGGFDVVFGWDELYVFRPSAAGIHTLTLEGDTGEDITVDMSVVEPAAIRALRATVSEQNRGTCLAVSGVTEQGLPVLGMTPAFMVDGESTDIASELGVLCFEEEPAPGTEVTAIWHTLSLTHTF